MNTKRHEEKDNKFNHRGHRDRREFLDRINRFFSASGVYSTQPRAPNIFVRRGWCLVHRRLCRPANKSAQGGQVRRWPKIVDGRMKEFMVHSSLCFVLRKESLRTLFLTTDYELPTMNQENGVPRFQQLILPQRTQRTQSD